MNFFGPPIALVLAVAGAITGHVFAYGYFLTGPCGISDVAETFPASASLQGWVCGAQAHELYLVPGVLALVGSTLLSLVLVVVVWSRGAAWRWLSPMPLVVTPVVVLLLLSLPPDTCTDDARHTHTASQCRTTSD